MTPIRKLMTNTTNKIEIRELSNREEMMLAYPLVRQMYEKMDVTTYVAYIDEMVQVNNFKMIGAFLDGKIIGASGYWVLLMLYCGRYIQASNLVVDQKHRSIGVGKILLDYIEKMGRKLECYKVVLDSYTENKKSHSLYYREGFYIRGFHFMKDL